MHPCIHAFHVAKLILASQHPNAELLENVLGIRAVAEPFREEAEKRFSAFDQCVLGRCSTVLLLFIRVPPFLGST
jgi:hypothetical protein